MTGQLDALFRSVSRVASSFAPLISRVEVTPLPRRHFDVDVIVMPWADVAMAERVVRIGLVACLPEVDTRVTVERMGWANFAGHVAFGAAIVVAMVGWVVAG